MMNQEVKNKHNFKFQFHGEINDKKIISILVEEKPNCDLGINYEGYCYYKIDKDFNIEKISYIDVDLAKLHTSTVAVNGDMISPAPSLLVTQFESEQLFKEIKEREIELNGLGKLDTLFDIECVVELRLQERK